MLLEAVSKIGGYSGVELVVLLDYVKVPHFTVVVGLPSSLRSSGQAHIGSRLSGSFWGAYAPLKLPE